MKKLPSVNTFALFCLICKSSKCHVHGAGNNFLYKCFNCGNQKIVTNLQTNMPDKDQYELSKYSKIKN